MGTLANGVISIVTLSLLLRALGPVLFGLWAFLQTFTVRRGWFVIADLDIGSAVTRYLARAQALEDKPAAERFISSALISSLCFSTVAAAGFFMIGSALIPNAFGGTVFAAQNLRLVILCLSLQIIVDLASDTFGSCITGLQRYDLSRLGDLVSRFMVGTLTVTAALVTRNLAATALASLVGSTIGAITLALILIRLHSVSIGFYRKEATQLIRYGCSLMALNIPGVVSNTIDRMVVGILLGPASVTLIEIAAQIAAVISAVQSLVTGTLAAASSRLEAREDHAQLDELVERSARYIAGLTYPLVVAVVFLASPMLDIWVGSAYHAAVPVIAASMLAVVIDSLGLVPSFILLGTGRANKMIPSYMAGTTVNVAMTVLLVKMIGPAGAPLATAIGSAIYVIPCIRVAVRMVQRETYDFVRRPLIALAAPLAIFTLVVALARYFGAHGFFEVTLSVALAFLLYTFAVIRWTVAPSEVLEIRLALSLPPRRNVR